MPFCMYFELKFWFPLLGEPRKRKGFAISIDIVTTTIMGKIQEII